MTASTKKTRLGRVTAWCTSWKAKRKAKLRKREDDRIRRIVAKEAAMIKKTSQRAQKRKRK